MAAVACSIAGTAPPGGLAKTVSVSPTTANPSPATARRPFRTVESSATVAAERSTAPVPTPRGHASIACATPWPRDAHRFRAASPRGATSSAAVSSVTVVAGPWTAGAIAHARDSFAGAISASTKTTPDNPRFHRQLPCRSRPHRHPRPARRPLGRCTPHPDLTGGPHLGYRMRFRPNTLSVAYCPTHHSL
jgi:hypothetical protein